MLLLPQKAFGHVWRRFGVSVTWRVGRVLLACNETETRIQLNTPQGPGWSYSKG